MINKVEICGVNTSKLPNLSNDKKVELLKKIKTAIRAPEKNLYRVTSALY